MSPKPGWKTLRSAAIALATDSETCINEDLGGSQNSIENTDSYGSGAQTN